MIRLQSISIRNFRGILELDLNPGGKSFAIQGPNGSGKSGVVDAVEFGLTGTISRLSGPGTAGLTTKGHGPHVDFKAHDSKVTLVVLLGTSGKTATIERTLDRPKAPRITPDNPETRSLVAHLEKHPEFVLSRREIIKYILTEAGKRAAEIQSLLKLERVEHFRSTLKTASNNLARGCANAETTLTTAQTAFKTALSLKDLSKALVLAEVNRLRGIAGVDALQDILPDVRLDAGVLTGEPTKPPAASKKVIQADLKTLRALYVEPHRQQIDTTMSEFSKKLDELRADPALVTDLEKRNFLELGLQYFDGQACPLCDTPWSEEALRQLVAKKLARLTRGKETKTRLLALAAQIVTRLQTVERPLKALEAAARTLKVEGHEDLALALSPVTTSQEKLTAVGDILTLNLDSLGTATSIGPKLEAALLNLEESAAKLPDETEQGGAKAILIQAQTRMEDSRKAKLAHGLAKRLAGRAKLALTLYDQAAETVMNSLYQEVEGNFTEYYRLLHHEDEAAFRAELKREAASVELGVDFYGRGLFPPVAYHSEGHQDGMGLCLYLALMQQVLGKDFSFAVLDDVVMSVDSSHRREVCRLLADRFPATQFILTTHDKVWLGQLHSSGLVTKKATMLFSRWSVDHGPFVSEAKEVWDEIREYLDADRVNEAAAALRWYIEGVAFELAERLRAQIPLRADCAYELGELLPSAATRWKELLGKAIAAAQSWGNNEVKTALLTRRDAFSDALRASDIERWAINPAVHYNEWANFSREDFGPVVEAFKTLLASFKCPSCGLWLYLDPPRPDAKTARCPCGQDTMNFVPKPREAGTALREPPGAPNSPPAGI